MTIPLNYAGPLTGIYPITNITPFTYRDGGTYLEVLESFREFINETLVPLVNNTVGDMHAVWTAEIAALNAFVNASMEAIDGDKAAVEAARDAALAAEAQAQIYAGQSATAADGAMTAVFNNLTSALRVAMDSAYAKYADIQEVADVQETGRLSAATLDDRFNAKADNTALTTAVTSLNESIATLNAALANKADIANTIKESQIDQKFSEYAVESRVDVANLSGEVGVRLNLPTHVSPSGGQATHPSLVYFPKPWNGYRYWMAYTPFPGANDDHEDPNIAVSDNGIDWIFAPGVTQPLDDADGNPEYNSDVSLVLGPDNTLFLFWRRYDVSATGNEETIWYRSSSDGVNWTAKALAWQSNETTYRYLSPSFVWENNRWTMYAVDMVPSPNAVIRRRWDSGNKVPSFAGIGAAATCVLTPLQAGKEAWHLEVRRIGAQWIMLLNDTTLNTSSQNGDLYFGSSTDGINWQMSGEYSPIVRTQAGEHDNLYKATFIPSVENGIYGFRVIYGAFLAAGSVWNIYTTFVCDERHRKEWRRDVAIATVNANGGVVQQVVTFDQVFRKVPFITITHNAGTLHAAVIAKSVSGFTVNFENYTAFTAATAKYDWMAQGI